MQANTNPFPLPLYFILPLFFVAVWILALTFSSLLSGWYTLANHFRSKLEPAGETRTATPFFWTVYFRYWTHYSGIVRLITAADGLYLSVVLIFRPGHPSLRIPWNEMQFSQTRRFFRTYVVLTLGNEERIPLRIPQRLADRLGLLDGIPQPGLQPGMPLSGPPLPPPLQ
ncbi:MAG TPA: hypothetical protein VND90_11635 [Terracidiphilus sp.]|nr:hypothetical protein [Terracidiphilus sp.]